MGQRRSLVSPVGAVVRKASKRPTVTVRKAKAPSLPEPDDPILQIADSYV